MASLAVGFEFTAQSLELLLLPILLDLFLWLGPRLSLAPLMERVAGFWRAVIPAGEVVEGYAELLADWEKLGEHSDLFALLSPAPGLGVPSLLAMRPALDNPLGRRPIIPVESFAGFLFGVVVILVIATALYALYLAQVGRAFHAASETPLPSPTSPWSIWKRLLGGFALLFAFVLFAIVPVLSIIGLLSWLSAGLATVIEMLFFSALLFLLFHLVYFLPALVLFGRSLWSAIRESLTLTHLYFNETLMLWMAIAVIEMGMNFVWTLPPSTSWGCIVGIVGHAFIDTALLASLFYFYQQRLLYLERLKRSYQAQPVRSQAKPS